MKSRVLKHHFNFGSADYDTWIKLVDERTPDLLRADKDEFEHGIRSLLLELRSSHTGFYGDSPKRFPPQHTINATLQSVPGKCGGRWMFLDVFEEGPAHFAGIRPGDILVSVDQIDCDGASPPSFGIGLTHRLTVCDPLGQRHRDVEIQVPSRKGSVGRPPIVEPKSLVHSTIDSRIGYLKCVYFPGAFGIEFGRELDRVVSDLNRRGCDRLILDLRGNIGGSLGFARLASYLCAGRMPIGHSLTPARLRTGYDPKTLPPVRMPDSVSDLAFTLARYAFRDKSIVLLTQGIGQQPFHGRIVVLVNQWTNSAGEMVACFALENGLASVIGQKTAGNVLGATNFRVGSGYWLRLPVFGRYTSRGDSVEGKGVDPKTVVDLSPEELSHGIDSQIQWALQTIRDL